MNKYTLKAYDFFVRDEEAADAIKELVDSGKPSSVIAEHLEDYVSQLDLFLLMAIYHELKCTVVDATDWQDVAHLLLCDRYGVPVGDEESIPEWDPDFDKVN
jgi:hypothetical protein